MGMSSFLHTFSTIWPATSIDIYLEKYNVQFYKIVKESLDDFCLNELETRRFPFELHMCCIQHLTLTGDIVMLFVQKTNSIIFTTKLKNFTNGISIQTGIYQKEKCGRCILNHAVTIAFSDNSLYRYSHGNAVQ